MEIKTERLIIREASQADASIVSKQNDSNSVNRFLRSLPEDELSIIFKDQEAVGDLLSRFANSIGNGNSKIYGAWHKEQLIGYISVVNEESGTPELQIEIAPKFHSKGLGYEFLSAVLTWLFDTKEYTYIRYTVLPTNDASIALVKKVGAFLQEPKSKIEKLLIRTFHITRLSMDAHKAHRYSSNHKPELENDSICGCFYCGRIFNPSEIEEWIVADNPCDRRGTAICPHCGIDSVIGESSGYPITDEFLSAMNRIWFN